LQVFEVLSTIETKQLNGNYVKDLIDPKKVYLIIDEITKFIYVLRPSDASLLQYLIGKRLALEVKRVMRGFLKIQDVTEENRNSILESPVDTDGKINELYNPNMIDNEDEHVSLTLATKSAITQKHPWYRDLNYEDFHVFKNLKKKKILEELIENPPLPNKELKLIIAGSNCLIPRIKLVDFIDERKMSLKYDYIGKLSDGWSIFYDSTPRLTIHHGRVQFIELFKNKSEHTSEILDIPLAPLPFERITQDHSIKDLEEAFNISKVSPGDVDELISEIRMKNNQMSLDSSGTE
jgi:hypothetical protein